MFQARPVVGAALLGLAALCSIGAGAQTIYRIVGPDGKVTFSDRPPEDAKAKASLAPTVSGANSTQSLPFELRQPAQRYPVTLYTAANCAPCGNARNFLSSRGIPFTERTVGSNEDIEALQRLAGSPTVPFATIGAQQLKGFSESEWSQFLDAAGYPKTSILPAGYRNPPPSPLVAVQAPTQPRAQGGDGQQPTAQNTPGQQQPPRPPAENPDNPAGIRF
ncbi:glutaredoxin domain-containing protein [Ramlibacter albus]|uniref:Glutaredoxin family protein n=1 Tax=Ramlibacter albus TaxID=2079448 RepID=A0A923M9F0_9BURK|nr:glutaredoxin domain-containing protein [Ramlibacter albus]MBC5766722.1 glutaredoxin family protein [Ramlibacter albus]